jgi:UDP-glucose 4-epimerase
MKSNVSNLRCLVLGAGGFLGKNLCLSLAKAGAQVVGFDRLDCPRELQGVVTWKRGEFANVADFSSELEVAQVIIHLVSTTVPGTSNSDIGFDIDSNLKTSIQLLELCRQHPGKRVIYASSGGAIYGLPAKIPVTESAATAPISSYGIVKLAIEKYLGLYEYLYGVRTCILRIANPFGRHQSGKGQQGAIANFMNRALSGQAIEIWGDGEVIRDYIHIDDVMSAFHKACVYEGDYRVFNIGSGVGVSLNQLVKDISRLIGKDISVQYHDRRKADVPKIVLDSSLAQRELSWKPETSFEQGLNETIAWMKTQI